MILICMVFIQFIKAHFQQYFQSYSKLALMYEEVQPL